MGGWDILGLLAAIVVAFALYQFMQGFVEGWRRGMKRKVVTKQCPRTDLHRGHIWKGFTGEPEKDFYCNGIFPIGYKMGDPIDF